LGALSSLFSRFGSSIAAAPPRSESAPVSARVPINVRDCDDDDTDEPTVRAGASVRNIRSERGAENDAPAGSRPRLVVHAAGKTDPGLRRLSNEDALLILGERGVFVVADGMGGHVGGEVASQLAVEAIARSFLECADGAEYLEVPVRAGELVQSLAAANEAVHSVASKDGRLSDMGTTVAAARFCEDDGKLYVGHVGDSRCYRLRDGALEQVTRDHTMAELGLTGREAAHLSRAVGPKAVVEVDVAMLQPRAGDVYLLCTDGLTKMVSNEVIREVLLGDQTSETAATQLIARANAAGGRDNVTALVIRVAARPSAERGNE
jgi:serine/threonine protein phosphatase PrpC